MADYIAKVKSSARRSDEVAYLAGQEVFILPETRRWIPPTGDFSGDYQFRVIPANAKGARLDIEVTLCAKHLTPLNKDARFVLSTEPPTI